MARFIPLLTPAPRPCANAVILEAIVGFGAEPGPAKVRAARELSREKASVLPISKGKMAHDRFPRQTQPRGDPFGLASSVCLFPLSVLHGQCPDFVHWLPGENWILHVVPLTKAFARLPGSQPQAGL